MSNELQNKHRIKLEGVAPANSTTFHIPPIMHKGNRTIADLRYGRKDIISPNTQICAPLKG